MKRSALVIVSFMSIILFGNAQVSNLNQEDFDTHMHDFGLVIEGDTAMYSFTFTNSGTDTLLLRSEDIRSSCGCVAVNYTKAPILPGEKGSITAYMFTKGRLGPFNKSVYYFHQGKHAVVLYIMGVIKAPENTTSGVSSKVSIDRTVHDFGKTGKSEELQTSFLIKNTGQDTLKITSACGCYCIQHSLHKEKNAEPVEYILPGKSAVLNITYSNSIPGKIDNRYLLFTNSVQNPVVTLTLKTEIETVNE